MRAAAWHSLQTPRTICERMTPELPRAPISEPLVTAAATALSSVPPVCSSSSRMARTVRNRLVPVSPSGTG